MSTLGTMLDRIQSETARTDFAVDGTGPISDAVRSAIAHYERRRFYFNEDRDITFSLSSSQEFYGSADNADIPNLVEIDAVTVTISNNRYDLIRRDYAWMEATSTGQQYTSLPMDYAYYAQQLRLYPIPNQGAPVRISAVKRLGTLSATTSTNAWMTDAEEMIRGRAKWLLWTQHIRNAPEEAAAAKALEVEAERQLTMETNRRLASGRVRHSYF